MFKNSFRGLRVWSTGPPVPAITHSTLFIQRPVLHEGWSISWREKCIQELKSELVKKDLLNTTDGDYDRETMLAVKKFQRANDLKVDGIVGQLTWAALLFPILRRTDAMPSSLEAQNEVKRLQRHLREEHINVEVDGFFGAETERGVKEFQKRYKVNSDGVCGYLTWSLLMGQKTEWIPPSGFLFLSSPLVEQLLIVLSVAAGIHFNPFGEESGLSLISILVVSYSLSCMSQPIISKLPVDQLNGAGGPLVRFAPYVLTGFFWKTILGSLKILIH